MNTSKLKFFSPIHTNNRLNILLVVIYIFYSWDFYVSGTPTHHFLLPVLIKLLDLIQTFKKYREDIDYSEWLSFKKTKAFIYTIYTKFAFFPLSLLYISLCLYSSFITESNVDKILETLIAIFALTHNVTYYKLLKELN